MQHESAIREPLILGNKTYHQITEDVCAPVEGKANKMWWMVFSIASLLALWGLGCIFYTVGVGIGVWGLNKTVSAALELKVLPTALVTVTEKDAVLSPGTEEVRV